MRKLLPALFLLVSFGLGLVSCENSPPQPPKAPPATRQADAWKLVSGERAMAHVIAQVGHGPRPSGSEALEKTRVYLEEEFKKAGWEVRRQEFSANTPLGPMKFANLLARFPDAGGQTWSRVPRVLISSHYDTKYLPDMFFVGANDGASSTGLLVELAAALAQRPESARQCELICFDGEEAIKNYDYGNERLPTDGLYGSVHYASELLKVATENRPVFQVNMDMVGDKDLKFTIPSNTDREMYGMLLECAKELGVMQNMGMSQGPIIDDHYPLGLGPAERGFAGLRVTNLLDLDYPAWHQAGDNLDKLSTRSLEISGQLALLLVEKYLLAP